MEKEKSKKCYVIFLTILLLLVIVFGGLLARRMINDEKVEGLYNKAYDKEIKIDASLATQPLTDAYIKGLNNFNIKADYSNTDSAYTKLINKQMTEEETLECLLALTIPVEDRSIYRERYRVNSELIKQDSKIEGIIKTNTYSGKISFEKLKQQIFSGESRVRGEEYAEVGTEISRQIEAIKLERNI